MEHGPHVGDVLGVEFAHIKRCQCFAVFEHTAHVSDVLGIEVAHIERCQCPAAIEHRAHVGDVLGVEVAQVERFQCLAAMEHPAHVGDVLGIEVAHIERCQSLAAREHHSHVGNLFGVKIPYALDILQIDAICEPRAGAGGAVLGKRGVEHGVLDFCLGFIIITCPSGFLSIGHVVDATMVLTGGALIVIIESECLVGC